jgi:hypothetical protein
LTAILTTSTETTELTRFLPPGAAFPDREGVCYRAAVSWTLPMPLLLFAGVVAIWPLAALVRRPTSTPRLIMEASAATLAVIAVVWAGWAFLWLFEQRW